MKKNRLILIFVICIFVSGCSANYELEIKNGKVKENMTAIETNLSILDVETESGWTLRQTIDSLVADDGFSKRSANLKKISNSKEFGIKYNNTYELDEINGKTLINECYLDSRVELDMDKLVIDSGANFKCYDYYEQLDSLIIKIKTNHKVIANNANSSKNGVYTWNITKDGNKNIYFEISRNEYKNTFKYILFFIPLIVILIIVLCVLKRKQKKNNKI